MDKHNLQQEKDLENEEFDLVDIKEEDENYTNTTIEHEQEVHADIPEFRVSVIKTESDETDFANVDPKLRAMPIVYTKRLDHMDSLHSSYYGKNTETILNEIWEESKPELKHAISNLKIHPQMETSIRWVKLRVTQLKKKYVAERESRICNNFESQNSDDSSVSISSGEEFDENVLKKELPNSVFVRNAKLLKMCQPCCIPLVRMDSKNSLLNQNINKYYNKNSNNDAYIIKDRSLNETNIFCVEKKVLIDYYRLKGINDSELIPYIKSFKQLGRNIKKVSVCCWYQRQRFIFLGDQDFSENVKKVMQRPHNCLYGKCLCCCGSYKRHSNDNDNADLQLNENSPEDTSFVLPEDLEIQNLEHELSETFIEMKQNIAVNEYGYNYNWLQDLLTKSNDDTVINKALNYNPPIVSTRKNVPKTLKLTATLFKVFYCNDQNMPFRTLECFELNQYGNIKMYAKNLHSAEIQKILDDIYIVRDDYKICCWRKRDLMLKNISYTMPDLARFLKSPHPCVAEKCVCCCSLDTRAKKLTLDNIILPKRTTPTHSVNITKINKTMTLSTFINNQMFQQKIYNFPDLPYTIPIKNTDDVDDCTIVDDYSDSRTINQNIQTMQGDDMTVEVNKHFQSCGSIQATNTIPQPTPPQRFLRTPSEVVSQAPKMTILANDNPQASAVDSMVTTILDRFKNVRLTIGDDGKVAAALDVPVNTMNTAELKVLASILAHAQNQVQVIRLANRVSESQTHNSNINLFPNAAQTPISAANHNISNARASTLPVETNPSHVQTMPTKAINQNTVIKKTNTDMPTQTREQIFRNFSVMLNEKNISSLSSFTDYVNRDVKKNHNEQSNAEPVTSQIPVIANVFSLKDANLNNEVKSALQSWSNENVTCEFLGTHKVAEPAPIKNNLQKTPTLLIEPLEIPSLKRKSEDEMLATGKIRVVDPAKLGITKIFDDGVANVRSFNGQFTGP